MNHLKWMGYLDTLLSIHRTLKEDNQHCDVVIQTSDISLKAHRVILCACSDFFYNILRDAHVPEKEPITIVIPDVKGEIMQQILTFIYLGEASINSSQLSEFLEAINVMGIKSAISFECHINRTPNISGHQPQIQIQTQQVEVQEQYTDEEVKSVHVTEEENNTTEVAEVKDFEYLEVYNEDEKVDHYTIEQIEDNGNSDEYILTDNVESYCVSETEPKSIITSSENQDALKVAVAQSKILIENESIEEDQSDYQHEDVDKSLDQDKIKKTYRHVKQDGNKVKAMEDAINAVIENGMSLQKAANIYQVSKTVLWRRLKKNPSYKLKGNPLIEAAIEKLSRGETLKKVSAELDIPLSTLHRHKMKLYNEGRLPENVQIRKKESRDDFKIRLQNAVNACNQGMSQNQASSIFSIPKSTLWRHARRFNLSERLGTNENSENPENSSNNISVKIEQDLTGEIDEVEIDDNDTFSN